MLIGRHLNIQESVDMLINPTEHKIIQVVGSEGLGRFSIAHYAVKYCYDRNYFGDGAFVLNLENRLTS